MDGSSTPPGKRLKRDSRESAISAKSVAPLPVCNSRNPTHSCGDESLPSPTNRASQSTPIEGDFPFEQTAEHLLGEGQFQDWRLDKRATEFAADLIQAPSALCAFGLQKIALCHAFVYDLGEPGDNDIITKESTRRIYDAAYDTCKKRPGMRVLLEGRQGTGKSRSLIYLLQKLLRSNTVVLFLDGRGSNYYAFLPGNAAYSVYSTPVSKFSGTRCHAAALRSTVLLFDPPRHQMEPPMMSCCIVVAASPFKYHYGNLERQDHFKRYLVNQYTADEAREFFRLVGNDISEADFAQRFYQVGGSLGDLDNPNSVRQACAEQSEALRNIHPAALESALENEYKILTEKEGQTSFHSHLLFAYHCNLDSTNDLSYRSFEARPVSAAVENALAEKTYAPAYARVERLVKSGHQSEAEYLLGILGRVALLRGGSFAVRELSKNATKSAPSLRLAKGTLQATMDVLADWASRFPSGGDGSADEPPDRLLLYPLNKSFTGVDLVDDRLRAYKFTLTSSHPAEHTSLIQRLDGIAATLKTPFCLYICVPKFRFDDAAYRAAVQAECNAIPELAAAIGTRLKLYMLLIPSVLKE